MAVLDPVFYDLSVEQLERFDSILEEMAKTKFRNRTNKNNTKKSTGRGESEAFGFIRRRNRVPGPCINNMRYPILYALLKKLGELCPVPYDAIQVNRNCVCAGHRDEGNSGLSLLLSGGGYTGGELITEGERSWDCNRRGLLFDGSKITHWNLPFEGTKISVIFFSITIPAHKLHQFPEGFRETFPYFRDSFLEHISEKDRLYFPNGVVRKKKDATKLTGAVAIAN